MFVNLLISQSYIMLHTTKRHYHMDLIISNKLKKMNIDNVDKYQQIKMVFSLDNSKYLIIDDTKTLPSLN